MIFIVLTFWLPCSSPSVNPFTLTHPPHPLSAYSLSHSVSLCRFLLPVRCWVPSLMCSVPCVWMQEACTPSFSANPLSASSRCFCHLTTCQPCDGGAALTHWVRWTVCVSSCHSAVEPVWGNVAKVICVCLQVTLHQTWAVQWMSSWGTNPLWRLMLPLPSLR